MIVTISPSQLTGTLQAPASKSSMQRACAAALAARSISVIHNPGHSNDDKAAMDIVRNLGAQITSHDSHVSINSIQTLSHQNPVAIHCGESGLSIRMFTPLAALLSNTITIHGSGSLTTRPMDFFDTVLPQLGVQIKSNHGKLPLQITGPLIPRDITIDGSLSSQFLTGLLLAYAAFDAKDVSIHVTNLKSKPYIDLTLEVMKQFGLKRPENRNYASFYFGNESNVLPSTPQHYTVEGDWSGAAFLLVAGAIAGPIIVKGLDVYSTQADKAVLQALMDCGAAISIQPDQIEIGPMPLKAFHFNATDCPDLFPPLVALASYCEGKTVLEGVSRLAHKESNRALTLQDEFGKMGVMIELQEDLMIIHGNRVVQRAQVHSRHDHRIAMASAVAALKADGPIVIEEAEAINKSYPDFYDHLRLLGATVVGS